jgi:hypothetical protein
MHFIFRMIQTTEKYITTDFQLRFKISRKSGPRKSGDNEMNGVYQLRSTVTTLIR